MKSASEGHDGEVIAVGVSGGVLSGGAPSKQGGASFVGFGRGVSHLGTLEIRGDHSLQVARGEVMASLLHAWAITFMTVLGCQAANFSQMENRNITIERERESASEITYLEKNVEALTEEHEILVVRFNWEIAIGELSLKTRAIGISLFKAEELIWQERAEAIYDKTIQICRHTLRDSRRVSEEIVMLLDPRMPDTEENAIVIRVASDGVVEIAHDRANRRVRDRFAGGAF
ncbi:hypothetical protein Pfo_025800 [Paulownia fortunei]|nr:hypothetical protein Pfo_025800 [Paulownia fortunei]